MGLYTITYKVEVYLLELHVHIESCPDIERKIWLSRLDTIAYLKESIDNEFEFDQEIEYQLWTVPFKKGHPGNSVVKRTDLLSQETDDTLQTAGILNKQHIVLELKTTLPHHVLKSMIRSTKDSTKYDTSETKPEPEEPAGRQPEPTSYTYPPGHCGLKNLGNTCFMNSALQCISNTAPLRLYFLEKLPIAYTKHINRTNPLGMGGAIANAFANLLEIMWNGQNKCTSPHEIKAQISKFAPRFAGYQQQDSQELMAFLLDGLHEDLNLVKDKPYVNVEVPTKNRLDEDIADERWYKHLQRHQSVIVQLFQGQLMAIDTCTTCKDVSKVFDPFMFLSLPIPPKKTRRVDITIVFHDRHAEKHNVMVSANFTVCELKKEVSKVTTIPTIQLDIFGIDANNQYQRHVLYEDHEHIHQQSGLSIYAVQFVNRDQERCVIAYHRMTLSQEQSYHSMFGLPVITMIPRVCTYNDLYRAVAERCLPSKMLKENLQEINEHHISRQTNNGHLGCPGKDGKDGSSVDKQAPQTASNNEHDGTSVDCLDNSGATTDNCTLLNKNDDLRETLNKSCYDQVKEKASSCKDYRPFDVMTENRFINEEQHDFSGCRIVSAICEWKNREHYIIPPDVAKQNAGVQDNDLMDCLTLMSNRTVIKNWYCSKCNNFKEASRIFQLWKLPRVLIVHLKRFSDDGFGPRKKVECMVKFPVRGFNLGNFVSSTSNDDLEPVYDLFAVCNHSGNIRSGHYTAYIKSRDMSGKQQWLLFDDTKIKDIKDEEQLVTKFAYVLFYERRRRQDCKNPTEAKLNAHFIEKTMADKVQQLAKQYNPDEKKKSEQDVQG